MCCIHLYLLIAFSMLFIMPKLTSSIPWCRQYIYYSNRPNEEVGIHSFEGSDPGILEGPRGGSMQVSKKSLSHPRPPHPSNGFTCGFHSPALRFKRSAILYISWKYLSNSFLPVYHFGHHRSYGVFPRPTSETFYISTLVSQCFQQSTYISQYEYESESTATARDAAWADSLSSVLFGPDGRRLCMRPRVRILQRIQSTMRPINLPATSGRAGDWTFQRSFCHTAV